MVRFNSSKILIFSSILFLGACAGVTPVGQKLNTIGNFVKEVAHKEVDAIALASWNIICNDLTWRAERKFRKDHHIDLDTFNKFCDRDTILKRDK